jgi:hypothetical protein
MVEGAGKGESAKMDKGVTKTLRTSLHERVTLAYEKQRRCVELIKNLVAEAKKAAGYRSASGNASNEMLLDVKKPEEAECKDDSQDYEKTVLESLELVLQIEECLSRTYNLVEETVVSIYLVRLLDGTGPLHLWTKSRITATTSKTIKPNAVLHFTDLKLIEAAQKFYLIPTSQTVLEL